MSEKECGDQSGNHQTQLEDKEVHEEIGDILELIYRESELGENESTGLQVGSSYIACEVDNMEQQYTETYEEETEFTQTATAEEEEARPIIAMVSALPTDEQPTFCGRYVTSMAPVSPYEVKKRFFKPKFANGGGAKNTLSRSDIEQIIRKLSGHRDLHRLVLFITPTQEPSKQHKVHFFAVDTQRHLGVTSLSASERDLIERHHTKNNFHLILGSRYVELEHLARNSPLRSELFKTLADSSYSLRRIYYMEKVHFMQHCNSREKGKDKEKEKGKSSARPLIPSLRPPLVSVRPANRSSPADKLKELMELSKQPLPRIVNKKRQDAQLPLRDKRLLAQYMRRIQQIKQMSAEPLVPKGKISDRQRKRLEKLKLKQQILETKQKKQAIKKWQSQLNATVQLLHRRKCPEGEKPKSKPKFVLDTKCKPLSEMFLELPKTGQQRIERHENEEARKIQELEEARQCRQHYLEERRQQHAIQAQRLRVAKRELVEERVQHAATFQQKQRALVMARKQIAQKNREEARQRGMEEKEKAEKKKQEITEKEKLLSQSTILHQMDLAEQLKSRQKEFTKNLRLNVKVNQAKEEQEANETQEAKEKQKTEEKQKAASKSRTLRFANIFDRPETATKSIQRSNIDTEVEQEVFTEENMEPQLDENGVRVLWEPQVLRESRGHIQTPVIDYDLHMPDTELHKSVSIVRKSSDSFEQLLVPLKTPPEFSPRACQLLQRKLRHLGFKKAFSRFGQLINCINSRPKPYHHHLATFFEFAEIFQFKIYVRHEVNYPGLPPPPREPRFCLECYFFEDRKDYIGSIALLDNQLIQFMRMHPNVLKNLRYIEDAFALTAVPAGLTNCLKFVFSMVRGSRIYQLLAELTYAWMKPKPTLLALTQGERPRQSRQQTKETKQEQQPRASSTVRSGSKDRHP